MALCIKVSLMSLGIQMQQRLVVLMTCNTTERLDPAMLRKGQGGFIYELRNYLFEGGRRQKAGGRRNTTFIVKLYYSHSPSAEAYYPSQCSLNGNWCNSTFTKVSPIFGIQADAVCAKLGEVNRDVGETGEKNETHLDNLMLWLSSR